MTATDTWTPPTTDGLPDDLRRAIADGWTEVALAEHASVASFATFVLDLLALGAPADLVEAGTSAMQDEIDHARRAFGLASAFAGESLGPGPLDTSGALARTTPAEVMTACIAEGCVGETVAAHEAAVCLEKATDPAIRTALETIAGDEADHAALAWKTVRWILEDHPELKPLATRAFDEATRQVRSRTAEDGPDLAAWGLLHGQARLDAAATALDEVVAPSRQILGV